MQQMEAGHLVRTCSAQSHCAICTLGCKAASIDSCSRNLLCREHRRNPKLLLRVTSGTSGGLRCIVCAISPIERFSASFRLPSSADRDTVKVAALRRDCPMADSAAAAHGQVKVHMPYALPHQANIISRPLYSTSHNRGAAWLIYNAARHKPDNQMHNARLPQAPD